MEFFEEENITVLPWPTNYLELSPIEHAWEYIDRKLDQYPDAPKGQDKLWERVQVIWENIPNEFLEKLHESIPWRLKEVRNKRSNTKY